MIKRHLWHTSQEKADFAVGAFPTLSGVFLRRVVAAGERHYIAT